MQLKWNYFEIYKVIIPLIAPRNSENGIHDRCCFLKHHGIPYYNPFFRINGTPAQYNLNMSRVTLKEKLIFALTAIFAASMVFFTENTENGTKVAIIIWLNSIVPVLLPFFIFSDFIKRTGMLQILPPQTYSFAAAFLSGYPTGAKIVADYLNGKEITKQEGKYILSYSLVTGPAFIIFTIGEFIGSREGAVIVAIAHYSAAFLNSLAYRVPLQKRRKTNTSVTVNYLSGFTNAIFEGFRAMTIILAYLMFFNILINMAGEAGLWRAIGNETLSAVLTGLMEMTVGINAIGMCYISMKFKIILAAFIVSFGGLSVIGQSASIASGSGITFADIVKIKISHGLWAGIVATLIMNFVVI